MGKSEEGHSLAHLREIKAKYEAALMARANVVAVGIGFPIEEGQPAEEPGIIVSVTHKVAASELDPGDRIPRALEDVKVWVVEIGQPRAGA